VSDEVVAPGPAVIEQNTSGVVGVLAEALAQHQWRGSFLGCKCGWNWSEPLTHGCGEDERIGHAHREHVASVVAALPNIAIVPTIRGDWAPGRWWRVIAPDGSLWCETSNEQEARDATRDGDVLERLYDGPHLRDWLVAEGNING
jgi:hypothetical protein